MKDAFELRHELDYFTGTEGYHYNPMYRWMNYTDGVKFFAENAGNGAYWFLDIIGTEMRRLVEAEGFLHIVLRSENGAGEITVDDGNDNLLWSKTLDFTDCPEGKWEFFLIDDVMLLPSEY